MRLRGSVRSVDALRVEPSWRHVPDFAVTFGPEVADVCARLDFAPDENQADILDARFAERDDGSPAAATVVVVCARQNLKTAVMEMGYLGDLLVMGVPEIVHTAHEFATARETFEHLHVMLDSTRWSSRRILKVVETNGREAIIVRDPRTGRRSRIRFRARTKNGARGLKASVLGLDEAFALQPSHMGALTPLLSTYANAQTVVGSSAGLAGSSVLRGWRDAGRSGAGARLAYFEWADDPSAGEPCELGPECPHLVGMPGCRLDDEERMRRANPTAGIRISWDRIRQDRIDMPPLEFARERLGWWDEPTDGAVEAIPSDAWTEAEDESSSIIDEYSFGLSIAPSRGFAAIAVAGRAVDSRVHLEVTSREGVSDYRPGVSWVLPRLRELAESHPGARLVVLRGSASETLLPALERIRGLEVVVVASAEYPAACGFVSDAADARNLAHLGQIELSAAVESAIRRPVADKAFQWGRRRSGGDISALVAATLAAWTLAPTDQTYDPMAGVY